MKFTHVCLLSACLGTLISFSSCKKDSGGTTSTVSFPTTSITYAEDRGAISIPISLSSPQSQDVEVNFNWSSTDTITFLGGNFTFVTLSPVTIPAGQTTANIQLQIINSPQITASHNVTLTLSSTSSNAILSTLSGATTCALTITNSNLVPANELQVDLVWYLTSSPLADINAVNLGLFLQDSVTFETIDNEQVISGSADVVLNGNDTIRSDNTTGFQTMYLPSTAPDSAYYIAIPYFSGSSAVSFYITLNGLGNIDQVAWGTYAATDGPSSAGINAIFYGPFGLSGGLFEYTGRVASSNSSRQKLLRFKAKDFKRK